MSDHAIRERVERALVLLASAPDITHPALADLLSDAREQVRFIDQRYEPVGDDAHRTPGLRDVRLPEDTAAEHRWLIAELERVTQLPVVRAPRFPTQEARGVYFEMRDALAWLGRDEPALAEAVERLQAAHELPRRDSEWVSAVSDALGVARSWEAHLRMLPAFDMRTLDEAQAMLSTWNEIRGDGGVVTASDRRARLAAHLRNRMKGVTEASDYAFRRFPAIAAEARSARQRARNEARSRTLRRNLREAAEKRAQAASEVAAPPSSAAEPVGSG